MESFNQLQIKEPPTLSQPSDLPPLVYSPLGPGRKPIRVLRLKPAEDFEAEIQCTLHSADLEDPILKYNALSYVWGDPTDTLPIVVNGCRLDVTVNCHGALRRLREVGETVLWIDAICINQRDNAERSLQVPLMGDVYSLAAEVIVWLADPRSSRTKEAKEKERQLFAFLQSSSKFYDVPAKKFIDQDGYLDFIRASLDNSSVWRSWIDLMKHPWFGRLWVLQEFLLASNPKMLFHYHFVPLDFVGASIFALVVSFKLRINLRPEIEKLIEQLAGKDENLELPMFRFVSRFGLKTSFDPKTRRFSGYDAPCTQVIVDASGLGCTELLDKVYGVMGLLPFEDDSSLQVNYNNTISQIYTQMTRAVIEMDSSLRCLCYSGSKVIQPIEESEFLSWVLNLSERFRFPIGILNFKADLGKCPLVSVETQSEVLEVKGIRVSRIVACQQVCEGLDGAGLVRFLETKCGFESDVDHLDIVKAVLRVLLLEMDPFRVGRLELRDLEDLNSFFSVASEGTNSSPGTAFGLENAVNRVLNIRRDDYESATLFVTESGYMGMGYRSMSNNDVVTVFLGAPLPLIVREENDYHGLIGPSVVVGIMDGEAVRDWPEDKPWDTFRLR